jgi:hypothetical protein
VIAPGSSCPGEESTPLRGAAHRNLNPTSRARRYECPLPPPPHFWPHLFPGEIGPPDGLQPPEKVRYPTAWVNSWKAEGVNFSRVPKLLSDCVDTKIVEQPTLSKDALLSLTSLLAVPRDAAQQVRDNLLQTVVDGCKGGQRGATRASGPDDRKGIHRRAARRNDQSRTDRSHGPHSGDGFQSGRRKR